MTTSHNVDNQECRSDWPAVLDLLGGSSDASFVRTIDDLRGRRDAPLALRADIATVRYLQSTELSASRARVHSDLRERYGSMNPFRFILCSEWSGHAILSVVP
jgi:hypothetical protein